MKETIRSLLEAQFKEFPMMKATAVPQEEIDRAENDLGCVLHRDYQEFLRTYGAAMVGSNPILGLRQAEVMGNDTWSVIDVTRRFRAEGWQGIGNSYVISLDGFGNPIGVRPDGSVWVTDHDRGSVEQLASSFEEYLEISCLR